MATIEVQDLGKVYPGGTVALDGVTFTVPQSEIFGFLGRNGAGKTTTVRVLTTLTRHTSGTVRVLGLDVGRQRAAVRRRVGLSLQQAALDDLMTGREHLTLIGALNHLGRAALRERVDELVAAFGLEDVADKLVATYTVGMRRRLDAAMALVHRPDVLFLDEPTTGLDPQSRRALWNLVRRYRDDGGTVFLTTQYLDEADALCDRIAILDQGRVAVIGTPEALKREVGGRVLRLPAPPPAARAALEELVGAAACRTVGAVTQVDLSGREVVLPALLARLQAGGVEMGRIVLVEPTIEDVFVRLTGEGADSGGTSESAAGVAAINRTIVTSRGGGR